MPVVNEKERLRYIYSGYRDSPRKRKAWLFSNPGNQWIEKEREIAFREEISQKCSDSKQRVLDIGCGAGQLFPMLERSGVSDVDIFGVDLIPDRLPQAKQRFPQAVLMQANGASLPFVDGSMDLVLIFTLFSSVQDISVRRMIALEAVRVLRRGGSIVVYDIRYDNPWNPNIRRVGMEELYILFRECHVSMKSLTLLPPLARRLGRSTDWLYPRLVRIPFLRTHYLCTIKKP